jgi:hypothetical protein
MSPFLFLVPSTLKMGHGFSNLLMGKCISLAYRILRKFSVAPESRSAIVSALFLARWMNRCSCIDFRIDRYILSDPVLLIQATQIRPPKNPLPSLPFYSSVPPDRPLRVTPVVDGGSRRLWLRVHFRYLPESSLLTGLCAHWSDSVWRGRCERSALVVRR